MHGCPPVGRDSSASWSADAVNGPTAPSATSPCAPWKSRSAERVCVPATPSSTRPRPSRTFSAACTHLTSVSGAAASSNATSAALASGASRTIACPRRVQLPVAEAVIASPRFRPDGGCLERAGRAEIPLRTRCSKNRATPGWRGFHRQRPTAAPHRCHREVSASARLTGPEGFQNAGSVHAAARWHWWMSPPSRSWRSTVPTFGRGMVVADSGG